MASEDKIDSLIDRKSFLDEIAFAEKSCLQVVEYVKQAKASIVTISSAANVSDFNAAMQKTQQFTNQAASAAKDLSAAVAAQSQSLATAASTLKTVAGSIDVNIQSQLKYKAELKDVNDQIKELQKQSAVAGSTTGQYGQSVVELTKRQTELKQAISENNTVIKAQAKEAAAATGSYAEMEATLKQFDAAFKQLSADERNGETGQSLIAGIKQLDEQLKLIDASTGKFQRNVGNYSNSLKPAFLALEAQLAKVQTQLAGMKETDPGFKAVQAEANVLNSVLETVDQTFTSSRQEMKAFTEATKQLGQQFGTTNELFQTFVKDVGEQKDKLGDIQKTINFNASDTKYLDGIVASVNGIVGAYGAWQAASVLLGDDNEKLQKSMAKLQAILTLVQSLQAVVNSVQMESGAIQTILAAKTALVVAAKKVEAIVFGQSTAALEVNTVVTEANAAAQVMLAEGEAAATVGAISLTTAIISTGIGALVLGLVYAISKLVGIVSDWIDADSRALEMQKALAEATNATRQSQVDLTEEIRKGTLERIDLYEKEVAVIEAKGISMQEQIAMETKVATMKRDNALQEQILNGVTEASRQDLSDRMHNLHKLEIDDLAEIQKLNDDALKNDKKVDKDKLDIIQKRLAATQSLSAGLKIDYDYQTNLLKDQKDADQTINLNAAKAEKLNYDERRKIILESTKLDIDLVTTKNNIILNSDKSTYTQKIAALKANLSEQQKLAKAEDTYTQGDKTLSPEEKALSTKKYVELVNKLKLEEKQTEQKITQDYNKKIFDADNIAKKDALDQQIQASKIIIEDDLYSYDTRLNALKGYNEAQEKLINADYENQKTVLNKTVPDVTLRNKLLQNLEAEHNVKLVQLTNEVTNKKFDVLKSYYSKALKEEQAYETEQLAKIDASAQKQIVEQSNLYTKRFEALSASFVKGKITQEQYDQDLQKLSLANSQKSVAIELDRAKKTLEVLEVADASRLEQIAQINSEITQLEDARNNASTDAEKVAITKQIELRKDAAKQLISIEKQVADARLNVDKLTQDAGAKAAEGQKSKVEALKKTVDTVVSYTGQAAAAIQSILGAKFDSQKAKIQEQIDLIDKQKDADIAAANVQALTAQEKADKITTIEKVAQAKKDLLAQKQRQLDNQKARQDRIFSLFTIATTTAQAVIKAVAASPLTGGLPFSAIAAAIGAAQIAAVLASPLPQYKMGTKDSGAEGYAWVGDGFRPEIVENQKGEIWKTPAKPTLVKLEAHSKVHKDEASFLATLSNASLAAMLQSGGQSVNNFEQIYIQALEKKLDVTNNTLASVKATLDSLPIQQWQVTDSGLTKIVKKGNTYTKHINTYFKS